MGWRQCENKKMILFNHLKLFLFICVSSLLIQAEPLFADTFYVATNGNNSNYGNFSNPWETIEYGVSDLQAGDTLYIREGTYCEKFSIIDMHGDESNPIIISGYIEERPIIDGENLVSGLWHTLLFFENTEYIIFQNIEVVNSRGSGIRIDENSHHITFHNIWLHSTGYDGIEANNSNYLTVEDSRLWNTNIVNDKNSPWYEFFMWGGAIMASGDPDSTIAPAHDIVIRGNEIFQNYGEGINIFGHVNGAIIEDNTFWDNWAPSIFTPNSENIFISGNLIYQTNDPRFLREGNPGSGIAFLNEPPPTRPGTMRNITVINNLVMGCNRNIAFWNDEVGGPLQNVLFAHNTLIDAHSNTGEEEHSIFISDAAHENVRFENNIILQEDNSAGFGYADNTGVSFSHNLWYPGDPPDNMQSSNDIYQNPLVLRRGSTEPGELVYEYFKIDENSPAIGAGIYLPEVPEDFLGAVRPGSPAIGAFEYYEILGASSSNETSELLTIFPNPVHTTAVIDFANLIIPAQITIYDLHGHVSRGNATKISGGYMILNSNKLPDGVYIVCICTDNSAATKRIVVIK